MEKPARVTEKKEPRHIVQPRLQERKTPQSTPDIRRELGWGLVEGMHKGALR